MAIDQNDVLKMYFLMGIKDPTHQFLKQRFPNVTYVLEHPDPTADALDDQGFSRDLFKRIGPSVYNAFHTHLKNLNAGNTATPDRVENTPLQSAYVAAGSMVDLADKAFAGSAEVPWAGGVQHPPSPTVAKWFAKLS